MQALRCWRSWIRQGQVFFFVSEREGRDADLSPFLFPPSGRRRLPHGRRMPLRQQPCDDGNPNSRFDSYDDPQHSERVVDSGEERSRREVER